MAVLYTAIHTHLRLLPNHAKVKLILILQLCLLPKLRKPVSLAVVVTRSLDVVLVFLEKTELLAVQRL